MLKAPITGIGVQNGIFWQGVPVPIDQRFSSMKIVSAPTVVCTIHTHSYRAIVIVVVIELSLCVHICALADLRLALPAQLLLDFT